MAASRPWNTDIIGCAGGFTLVDSAILQVIHEAPSAFPSSLIRFVSWLDRSTGSRKVAGPGAWFCRYVLLNTLKTVLKNHHQLDDLLKTGRALMAHILLGKKGT